MRGDVSNLEDVDRLVATIKGAHAHIDVYFANAGSGEFLPLGETTEEHFDATFNINVKGIVFGVQKALPLIRDGGSIIVNALIAGPIGQPAFSIYAALESGRSILCTDLDNRSQRSTQSCQRSESRRDSAPRL